MHRTAEHWDPEQTVPERTLRLQQALFTSPSWPAPVAVPERRPPYVSLRPVQMNLSSPPPPTSGRAVVVVSLLVAVALSLVGAALVFVSVSGLGLVGAADADAPDAAHRLWSSKWPTANVTALVTTDPR